MGWSSAQEAEGGMALGGLSDIDGGGRGGGAGRQRRRWWWPSGGWTMEERDTERERA